MLGRKRRTYGERGRTDRGGSKGAKRSRVAPRFRSLKSNVRSSRAQSARVTLIYNEQGIAPNPAAGVTAVYVFAANGLYDPNITGVGHQPSGFDQYMALYNEYVVLGSTITVWYTNNDGNNHALAGVFLEDFDTTDSDWRKYVENGNGVWTVLDKLGTGNGIKCLKHQADITKFSTQGVFNEDGFAGTSSRNPDDTHFYHIVVAPADAVQDNAFVLCNVEIRYDVLFRDPALTALS